MNHNNDNSRVENLRKNQPDVPTTDSPRGAERIWREAATWRQVEGRYRALQARLASTEGKLNTARMQNFELLEKVRTTEAGVQRLMDAICGYDYHVVVQDGHPVSTTHGQGCVLVTGYAPEEYSADPLLWYRMVHEEDRTQVLDFFRALLREGKAAYLDHRIRHKSGAIRWVRNSTVVLRSTSGLCEGYDGIIVDITEQKELEGRVRQAQKMEVVAALFGGIVHDFNNLLTAIAGHAYIIGNRFDAADPRGHSAKCLIDVTERAKLLTGRLLSFSRKASYHRKMVKINELVKGCTALMRPLIPENITLVIRLCPEDPVVAADPGQLEQVVMNLAVNAVDAMPGGGQLLVTTAVVDRAACGGRLSAPDGSRSGQFVMLTVADEGSGISPAVRSCMYDPFFTTKGPDKGSGLGLSIVNSIMNQHGGFIDCSSEPGQGTEFRLYLPRAMAEQEESGQQQPPAVPTGKEHIVLADDDRDVLVAIAEMLESLGYDVTTAAGGDEALAAFRKHAEDIQCLVLNYALPGKNGIEVYEEISTIRPHVPVVFITGYPNELSPLKDISYLHSAALYKPFSPSELGHALRTVLTMPSNEQKTRASESVAVDVDIP